MTESKKLTIAVDVDEVCADLIGAWLMAYNRQFLTNFLPEDIEDWDVSKTVQPKRKEDLYGILANPHLYETIIPIVGARAAVRNFRENGHRVVFVTTCVPGTEEAKRKWLVRNGFLEETAYKDYVAIADKSLIRADILFDDKPDNVSSFRGTGVLVRCPHNRNHRGFHSVDSLASAPAWVLHVYPKIQNKGV